MWGGSVAISGMLSVLNSAGESDRKRGWNAGIDEDCGRVGVCGEHWALVGEAYEVLWKAWRWKYVIQKVGVAC